MKTVYIFQFEWYSFSASGTVSIRAYENKEDCEIVVSFFQDIRNKLFELQKCREEDYEKYKLVDHKKYDAMFLEYVNGKDIESYGFDFDKLKQYIFDKDYHPGMDELEFQTICT